MNPTTPTEHLLSILNPVPIEKLTHLLSSFQNSDWQEIIALSDRQYISPVMYKHLKRIDCSRGIPPPVLDSLHYRFLLNMGRNARMLHDLSGILKSFRILTHLLDVCPDPHFREGRLA